MKTILCFLSFLISIQSSGQAHLLQSWISPDFYYLEIGTSNSKAGYSELKEYKTKLKRNTLTLKSRRETLKFKILKCENDSMILTSLNLSANYFLHKKDTALFISQKAFFNNKIDFKILKYNSGNFEYTIDSTGLLTLIGNKRANIIVGTYTSQLSKEVLEKLNYFIQAGDISKAPVELSDPFGSQPFYLDVYFFDRRYNYLLNNVTWGSYPPYILKDFINYIRELPKNIQLTMLDKPD